MKRMTAENIPYDDPMASVPAELLHLIPGFLERREKEVDELTDLLAHDQFEGIKAIGHRLKGTGLGYGFPVVTEIGRELETAAVAKDRGGLRKLISRLEEFATALRGFLP